ncbi:MAG: hypothetical protein R3B49_00565 [Phycisphaerales bacterium]
MLLSVPVLTTGPGGGPVIDLDEVLLGNADDFFGGFTDHADDGLARIREAKAFPNNVEIDYELPPKATEASGYRIHYSLGMPPKSPGYEPREADRHGHLLRRTSPTGRSTTCMGR